VVDGGAQARRRLVGDEEAGEVVFGGGARVWAGGNGCRRILNPRRQELRRRQVVAEGVEREVRQPWEATI
jgi:hypothetical protein